MINYDEKIVEAIRARHEEHDEQARLMGDWTRYCHNEHEEADVETEGTMKKIEIAILVSASLAFLLGLGLFALSLSSCSEGDSTTVAVYCCDDGTCEQHQQQTCESVQWCEGGDCEITCVQEWDGAECVATVCDTVWKWCD